VEPYPQALHEVIFIAFKDRPRRNLLRLNDVCLVDLQLFQLLAVVAPGVPALLPLAWPRALWRVLIQRARFNLGAGPLAFQDRDLVLPSAPPATRRCRSVRTHTPPLPASGRCARLAVCRTTIRQQLRGLPVSGAVK
jgi:hypothetical protein